ncbi:MAG: hypothetical protein ACPKPY_00795 [Nitrososphaeraceae archaeon]
MGSRILPDDESSVIQGWLMGKPRDVIASETGIGGGSVSKIIKEWKTNIGLFDADALRKLGIFFRKSDISPLELSKSLRQHNICKNLGIDENNLYLFTNDLYKKCKDNKIQPSQLVEIFQQIISREDISSFTELERYIDKKIHQKNKLALYNSIIDFDIAKKRKDYKNLEFMYKELQTRIEKEKEDFNIFKVFKKEFENFGIPFENLESLLDVIRIFTRLNYNPIEILCQFSSFKDYEFRSSNMKNQINGFKNKIKYLEMECSKYEKKLESNKLKLVKISELKNMGFGLPELSELTHKFKELSKEYNIEHDELKDNFFKNFNKFCDEIYYNNKIIELKNELDFLNKKIESKRKIILSQPNISKFFEHLKGSGITEDQFINIISLFSKITIIAEKYNDQNSLEKFANDMEKYSSMSNILKDLENQKEKLQNDVNILGNQLYMLFLFLSIIYKLMYSLEIQNYVQKSSVAIYFINFYFYTFQLIDKDKISSNNNKKKIKKNYEEKNKKETN